MHPALLSRRRRREPVAVVYAAALDPFVAAARTRRVDIAGIGDSNQVFGDTYGHDHGMAKAWIDRMGEYATMLFGFGIGGGFLFPAAGYFDGAGALGTGSGAPAALDDYRLFYDAVGDGTNDLAGPYGYLDDTESRSQTSTSTQFNVVQSSPLWGKDLEWRIRYGTLASGAGGFSPAITRSNNATVELAVADRIDPVTGAEGLVDTTLALAASAYSGAPGLAFRLWRYNNASHQMLGPFFGLHHRVVASNVLSGVGYSTLLYQGGRTARDAALALQTLSDAALAEHLRGMVVTQDDTPMLLVQVIHGGNDRADTADSVGPSPTASNTPAGLADNHRAIVARLREVWTGAGYDSGDLYFLFGPYHPQSGTQSIGGTTRSKEAWLRLYEEALIEMAGGETNIAVARGSHLTSVGEMTARSWYTSGVDDAHLSQAGYEGLGDRLAQALRL